MARLNRGVLAVKVRTQRLVGLDERGYRVGETHHRAKLTDADVEQIFALRSFGLSYLDIARKFDDIPGGLSKSMVRNILTFRKRVARAVKYKRCT